ncbi:MAG: LysM peptidoglycan-binding domain-containing protein, partial [Caldimicrobium sp.]
MYHQVKRGETLSDIARRYGVSLKDLREWNNLRGDKILIGQRLIIKREEVSQERQEKIGEDLYHVVKRGENLSLIAKKYGVSVEDIKKLNKLRGNKIFVGQ